MGDCGEGNGNPLQYSCLDNPVDRGPWWAAVHGVVQGRTRLKQLSVHACIGEGNGSPLQCFCLENPRDTGAWWAAVCGAAQSRTWLESMSKQWWGEVAKKHTHTHAEWHHDVVRPVMEVTEQKCIRKSIISVIEQISVSKFSVEDPVYRYYVVTFMYSTKYQ